MSKIFAVVGPSGVGKTTAVEWASKALGVSVVRSYTTRPMRPNEVDGIDHIFVRVDEMPDRDAMAAYTYFGGNHYWATKQQVTQEDVLYVIDEKGLLELIDRVGNAAQIVRIYIEGSRDTEQERAARDADRISIPRNEYDAVVLNDGTLEQFLYRFTALIDQLRAQ